MDAEVKLSTRNEFRRPKAGFDIGNGSFQEGDSCIVDGKRARIFTVYQDGDVQVEITEIRTIKWRFVQPLPESKGKSQ